MPRLSSLIPGTRKSLCACVLLACWTPAVAAGQAPDSGAAPETIAADQPAHVSFVDGPAVLERDGQSDSAPANMPLLAGDRIRTQGGRVEILFADGSTLHVDTNTTVDFQSDELLRLLDGRVRLAISGPSSRRVSYRIDAPSASAVILQPGEYKVSILHSTRDGEIELAVVRGGAELVNDDGRTPLRAGERAYARMNATPSYAYAFNSASWDAFDRWSEMRREQRLAVSTQYLPEEVRPYATSFDQYGAWQYAPAYGYVWYPRVGVDWRPYYRGRWVTLRPYGWTWVGLDPFAWPTHHFGRWGFSAGAWFWIPGRTWGPAWVSWGYAPGYVSWCPLGWNNRAVIQINAFSGAYYPWHAWTVVPRPYFGVGYVHGHYVNHVAPQVWRTFAPRYTAPATVGHAVPRSAEPIRVAGTVAARRSPSIVYTNLEPGAARVPSGGQRVVVGQPRSSVAPDSSRRSAETSRADESSAAARGTSLDRGARTAAPIVSSRSFGVAGQVSTDERSDDVNSRRAVPRDQPMYRTPTPSVTIYGPGGRAASEPRANDGSSRRSPGAEANGTDNVYVRRPPANDSPTYGVAVPRERPGVAGPGGQSRPSGGFERPAPSGDRPAQGPPPPPPSGAGDRGGPGTDRGQGSPPAAPAGGGGGHTRGGGQPTGRAVPRGRG